MDPLTDNLELGTSGAYGEGSLPQSFRGIGAAAAVIFLGSVTGRILGLLREQLAAREFGAGDAVAAFTVADNLNTLMFDLIANGMLQAALIPVLATIAIAQVNDVRRLREVTGALLAGALLLAGAIVTCGVILAPQLIKLMTAVGGAESERNASAQQLAITNLRIVLPSLVFLAAGTVLMATLYSLERPAGPSAGVIARNAAAVVAILLFGNRYGVKSMALGVVGGAALMVLFQFVALRRARATPNINLHLDQSDVREVFRLYFPVLLGLIVSTFVIILDRNLAWRSEEDAVGAMRYATALVQLILGLVVAAVSLAVLPQLSFQHAADDEEGFRESLARALRLVTVLIIPAVLGMAVLATPIVRLLFEHGETDRDAARLITRALLLYLPGHLLAGYDQVLIFAFYARRNTVTPVLVGFAASGTYVLSALLLFHRYEMAGLVAANSIQFLVHTVIMVWLSRRVFGLGLLSKTGPTIARVGTASLLMVGVVWVVWKLVSSVLSGTNREQSLPAEFIVVFLPVICGGLAYFGLARTFGIGELTDLLQIVQNRFKTGLARNRY